MFCEPTVRYDVTPVLSLVPRSTAHTYSWAVYDEEATSVLAKVRLT